MDSPVPPTSNKKVPETMTFPKALEEVMIGKRITRVDWDDEESFGLLRESYLSIRINGKFHQWMVNDGDMMATDWYVLEDVNA